MIVYIAGPYRAATESQVYENIQDARDVGIELARKGIMFFCPHTHTAFMGGVAPDSFFLEMGIEFLKKCGAILMIGEWRSSAGACDEHDCATLLGMKIYYDIEEVIKDCSK